MSSTTITSSAGRALTPGAIALMLMLCLSWGFNQIAVKLVLPDVPPMLQALIALCRRVCRSCSSSAGFAA